MSDDSPITGDTPFRVGDWHVDPNTGRVKSAAAEVKLEPKVMAVLVCLARQPGKVVTREQLEATVWAGVVVGYDSLASTIIKLRKAFADDSKQPRIIETVPKKGYRLIAGVGPVLREAGVEPDEKPPATSTTWVATGLVTALLLLGIAVWLSIGSRQPVPDPGVGRAGPGPSIAVLPFKNISNDPGQDYFSDGMTADLITDLSQISGLSVIARNSVFAYKDTDVDVRQIGRELGVLYVLEGSIRKVGDKVRISARLSDTGSGYNLWAERFDSALSDVFALQDEVTAKIVATLEIRLTEKERELLAHRYTASIDAYDYFLRGWESFWEFSETGNQQAKDLYAKAIALDAGFARAYANMAIAYAYESVNGWSDDPALSLEKARHYAQQAVAIDAELPQVYWALGLTQMFGKDYKEALSTAEKSIALNPNYADGYGLLATILNYAGRPRQALTLMQKAMLLNPRHPFAYNVIRGEIYFNLHSYDSAVDDFLHALERNPDAYEPRLWLAAAYAHLGRADDAGWEVEQIRNSGAEISLDHIEQVIPLKDPVQRKHLIDGLGKAGLTHRQSIR